MNYKLREMSMLEQRTMNALDSILKSCIPTDESSKRRPSIFSVTSKQSNSQTLLTTIEETFENIVHLVHGIPTAIEEKLEDLMQTVIEIPTTIEESFDDLIHTLNEYVYLKCCLT
jgi:hypothetical protein